MVRTGRGRNAASLKPATGQRLAKWGNNEQRLAGQPRLGFFWRRRVIVLLVALGLGLAGPISAWAQDDATLAKKQLILPGETFSVEGRPAFIFWPPADRRHQPQPWVMYAPTLPAYPDSHEQWMHQQFLDAGIAVAGIDMDEAYGSPAGTAGLTALHRYLTTERGFAAKPCLLGRSRGGLWVSSWAIAHPQKVAGIIAIYPVFDLRTYPGLDQAAPAYRLTAAELAEQLLQYNPIEQAAVLAEHRIPIAIIHGDIDTVVPLGENSQRMADVYRAAGAEDCLHLEVVPGQGHNYWEGFFRSPTLVKYGIQWATAAENR